MKKIILIILSSILFLASCNKSKTTDLTARRLNGSVKRISIKVYNINKYQNDSLKIIKYNGKTCYFPGKSDEYLSTFSKNGRLIYNKPNSKVKYKSVEKGKSGWYDSKRQLINVDSLKASNVLAKTYKYFLFDENHNLIEEKKMKISNLQKEIKDWSTYEYNHKNMRIKTSHYYGDSKESFHVYKSIYDEDGFQIKQLEIISFDGVEKVHETLYDNLNYDSENNWTKRIEVTALDAKNPSKKTPYRLIEREIEYY